uniref:EGF-like domain-containing protein n=1 Tax=Trichuris muris TaxID=70415 RepID=A0A5S6QQC6_TRIMR
MCLITLIIYSNNRVAITNDFFQCDADYGYISAFCAHPFIPCENQSVLPCEKCKDSLTGKFCQIDSTNPCGQFPCGSNGNCTNSESAAVCQCFPGYEGDDCQIVVIPRGKNKNAWTITKTLLIMFAFVLLAFLIISLFAINQQMIKNKMGLSPRVHQH